MPSIARTSIISGPARITFGGQNFWSKGDVAIRFVNDRFNIETAHKGKVDERFSGRTIEVTFEPSGRFNAAIAGVLCPYGSTAAGASIFTAVDVPLTINGRDGRQIVVHAAAVTRMPSLRLAVNQTIFGAVTFTGIVKNNTDPSAAAAYYTESAVAYPGDTGFDVSDILTKHCSASWGSAPWNAFLTEAGWTIDFDLQLTPQVVDGIGVVDMTFQSLAVTAKCIPIGPTAANILGKVCPTTALGTSISTADDLVIEGATAGDPFITISSAAMVESGLLYGAAAKRIGETTWVATQFENNPLFLIGVQAE